MNTSLQKEPVGSTGVPGGSGIAPRTVLVPMLNLSIAGDMLHLAGILASGHRPSLSLSPSRPLDDADLPLSGPQPRIVVLGVVEVPEGQPLTTGMDMARSYRALFEFLPPEVDAGGRRVRVDRLVKVARDVPSAIRAAVEEEHADIVLAHWRGQTRQPRRFVYGHILDPLLKEPPCDIVLARPEGLRDCGRVLLPVRGGPSAAQALDMALLLAEYSGNQVTVLHNVPASRGNTGPLGEANRASGHQREASIREAIETGPYIEFNEYLEGVARTSAVRIERLGTVSDNTASAVLGEIQHDDVVIMGMGAPVPPRGKGAASSPNLPVAIAAGTQAPLLLLRTCETVDLERYKQQAQHARSRAAWVDMPFEYWFVENTYHGDEFRDPEEFLKLKRSSGLTISVAVLTSNDARHMRSVVMGLKRVLLEMQPLADQLAVVDAGSGDGTLDIAHSLGVDAYVASEILPDEGSLHGRGESWWKSLAVLRGDIVVWLDPRATRFHPSTALSLAGPLLRRPPLQLVKAFAASSSEGQGKAQGEGEERGQGFTPGDVSWGGFMVPRRDGAWPFARRIRVQALKPADLLALTPQQFASLPPRTILQVLYPALAGVADPFGRDFAARRDAMLTIPAFTASNLEVGVLLSVASRWGTQAIAQVELRHAQPAPPPQPGLSNAMEVLHMLSLRLDDPDMRRIAADTAERLRKELEGPTAAPDERFQVRALNPVERPPMSTILHPHG